MGQASGPTAIVGADVEYDGLFNLDLRRNGLGFGRMVPARTGAFATQERAVGLE